MIPRRYKIFTAVLHDTPPTGTAVSVVQSGDEGTPPQPTAEQFPTFPSSGWTPQATTGVLIAELKTTVGMRDPRMFPADHSTHFTRKVGRHQSRVPNSISVFPPVLCKVSTFHERICSCNSSQWLSTVSKGRGPFWEHPSR